MIITGIFLLLLDAFLLGTGFLSTIGWILVIVGAILMVIGAVGRTIGPRRYYW